MPKILIIGIEGQVGYELSHALYPLGQILASSVLDFHDPAFDFEVCKLDLTNTDSVRTLLRDFRPDYIVNAAAYTNVDGAETERDLATAVNANAPRLLAELCRELGSKLIHYSTDYVYEGSGEQAQTENQTVRPQNHYGQTKLAGDMAIAEAGIPHLILRTSWVFSYRGKNFLRTILRLARERDELRVVDDQIGAPSSAKLIAQITSFLLAMDIGQDFIAKNSGVYHLVNRGFVSWHGFASEIIRNARDMGVAVKTQSVVAVSSEEYPLPAKRPKNSRLSTRKIEDTFHLRLPHWTLGLKNEMKCIKP